MQRVVALAFVWGWSFLFIKVAVEGFPPFTVAAARMALGCLALMVVARLAGVGPLPRDRAFWRAVTFNGVIGTALPFTLLAWGEERITSALTAVAQATTALFTALFAALLLGERLRNVQVAGLVLGLVGVAVAAGVGGGDLTSESAAGVLAAMAAGAAYGLAFVHAQRRLLHVDPMLAASGQLFAGTLALAPFAIAAALVSGVDATPNRLGALVLLGVVNTGLAYWLNYGAIAQVGATAASLVTYLIPPVAIVAGWLVLDEPVGWRLLVGLALIVVGVAGVRRPARAGRVAAATQGG
jgi:drug/metabolite transporter (DMT)-like permease